MAGRSFYLLEFKLDQNANAAMAQIVEKQYALPYAVDTRKLFKIGVNYDSAARNLTEWKVVGKAEYFSKITLLLFCNILKPQAKEKGAVAPNQCNSPFSLLFPL